MPIYFRYKKYLLLLLLFALVVVECRAQYNADSASKWIKLLEKKERPGNELVNYLVKKNLSFSPGQRLLFKKAIATGDLSNPYYWTRYTLLKAAFIFQKSWPAQNDSVQLLCEEALKKAYETGDQEMVGLVSWHFGAFMHNYGHNELAVMYCLNAADISEKTGVGMDDTNYWVLGEVLYNIREYGKTIYYCKRAAAFMQHNFFLCNCINTIGLSFQKLGQYDSALYYYDSAMLATPNMGDTAAINVWKGIISGNIGQVYFLQGNMASALSLFTYDYERSMAFNLYDNAANSLQWAAKTNLELGKAQPALSQIRQAFKILALSPSANYYQNLYKTAADIYRKNRMADSALYFSNRYLTLHDSLEAKVATSRLEISRLKLENKENYYRIRSSQNEKSKAITTRNLVIICILLLAITAIIYVNSLRIKSAHRQQLMVEKNKLAELEIVNTKNQLTSFTQMLVEKAALIDQLEIQLHENGLNEEQHAVFSRLLESRIITEEEWTTFKSYFEKIYPGFFHRLKENYNGITTAEQRMASLIKLRLTTKEIAAMLGISVESVHKTRQRLKQRLSFAGDSNLEDFVAAL